MPRISAFLTNLCLREKVPRKKTLAMARGNSLFLAWGSSRL